MCVRLCPTLQSFTGIPIADATFLQLKTKYSRQFTGKASLPTLPSFRSSFFGRQGTDEVKKRRKLLQEYLGMLSMHNVALIR